MDKKQNKMREEADQDDQYSRPECRTRKKQADGNELGPNATQLLGILQSLQKDDS
ncbi:MAG: hypothetical protein OER56_04230 [Hyphomicrobiales bacterium]|nr:hypothetical protein [Hyphomicrobiales bacterium]